ncbi:MAG TPA: hypothetical protein VIU29_00745 [Candidatus Deferrimicrobiaceae bacterium]
MKKAFFAAFGLFAAGCATSPEITAWNMAREVNTPAAYQNFLQRHPDSGHADEARERVGKSEMEQIMAADTVAECVRTMKTKPDPKIAATVAELAYKAALKESSPDALYDFLAFFKGHAKASEIRSRLEELEFKAAGEDASPTALEFFLLKYPNSSRVPEAGKLLAEKSYAQVKAWDHPFGYKGFLQRFPDSPRAAEVRRSIPGGQSQAGTPVTREALAAAAEKSPWLKKYGCALALSAEIAKAPAEADSLRRSLRDLEKGNGAGSQPATCSSVALSAKPGGGEALAEALRMMAKAEERRKSLATRWKSYSQGEDMAKGAVGASTQVADELEAAELSEDVLGSGPLGGLDVGKEKGSVSARKAIERFGLAEKTIARDRADIKRMLLEMDALYRPLQYYVTGVIAVQ